MRSGGSTPGVGCVEHVRQFALNAKSVRPTPKIVKIDVYVRILDDAQHIFKIMRATGLELQENQVLRTADIQGDAEKLQRIDQFGARGHVCGYEQVNIVGGAKTAHALTASAPTRQYGLDGGSAETMA